MSCLWGAAKSVGGEMKRHFNYKHGHCTGYRSSKTYASWHDAIARCTLEGNKRYKDYGGRGIIVCDRWMKFENFLADMGEKPFGKTLDRIDTNGNYEPSNCQWADAKAQSRNRRYCVLDESKASEIRKLHDAGLSYRNLATKFNVSKSSIAFVCTWKTWA